MKKRLPFLSRSAALIAAVVALSLILHPSSFSQSPDFDKTSLALRTALHFDPAAEAPLKKLAELYATAGKRSELAALYLSHLSQYPQDESARVVLARLYLETNDERAADFLRESIEKLPQSALLAWANHLFLASRFESRAIDELDRAIAVEKSASRRAMWLADLVKLAAVQEKEPVVVLRFKALITEQALPSDQRIRWARQCLTRSLPKAAAVLIEGADLSAPQGDASVEATLVIAETEAANGKRAEAAKRLDELLGKLAADYWRRREVLLLRLQVTGDAADREALITAAKKRVETSPANEAEIIALADLLAAAQRKSEALDVLEEAASSLPESRAIEARLLDLFEATNEEARAIAFISEQLKKNAAREDLALQRIRLLLATGRSKEGLADLNTLLKTKAPDQRATTHLDTARWLRARNLLSEAAVLLEILIADLPQRWDARKELGELYAVLKRKEDLDQLFAVKIADDVAPEVRLEIVQFLIAQKQWQPARDALEKWITTHPSDLESRLLLARICATIGDVAAATKLIAESRALCDTDARYAGWLNAAFTFADESERAPAFVEEERTRLWKEAAGKWDAASLSRLLALAEAAGNAKLDTETESLVRKALAEPTLKEEQRRELNLRLLDVIERQAGREKEIETQLIALTKSPGANADDLNLRLALLYHSAKRLDLSAATFEKVNIGGCQEAKLLARAASVVLENGDSRKAADFLARVVQIQPEEAAGWIQWTSALVSLGDEHTLRLALRQMLSLSAKWKLHADSVDLLRRHLAASCWREVGRLICRESLDEGSRTRAMVVLDEAERLEMTKARRLWAAWTRARLQARDDRAAVKSFVASLAADAKWIPFPDGLTLSAQHASDLLATRQTTNQPATIETATPVLAPFDLAWGYQAASGTRILRFAISPSGRDVIVADDRLQLSIVDRATGKLRWTTANMKSPPFAAVTVNPNNMRSERVVEPVDFAADDERVFISASGRIDCRQLSDGDLLWSHDSGNAQGTEMVETAEDLLFLWQPDSGALDAIRASNGKLAWTRTIEPLSKAETPQPGYNRTWVAAGLSVDDGKVLAYASGAAVFRASDGAVLWQATADEAPAFPLEMRGADDDVVQPKSAPVIKPWNSTFNSPRRPMMPFMFNRWSSTSSGLVLRTSYTHPLALNLGGWSGMYGNMAGSPFLKWGSEGIRVLRADTIWSLGTDMTADRVSVSGLPFIEEAMGRQSMYGFLLGFAGGKPVMAANSAITRGSNTLWQHAMSNDAPANQAFPAATLNGRTLLVASADGLLGRDAITGEILFRTDLPAAVQSWAKDAWQQLKSFQSVRWSARGIMLYDGNNSSLVVDWRSAARNGDWIIPLGLDKLGCLRGARQTASTEGVK